MECHHIREKDPLRGAGGHKKMITPQSHKDTEWKHQHGLDVLENVDVCKKCHNYTNIERKLLKNNDQRSSYI